MSAPTALPSGAEAAVTAAATNAINDAIANIDVDVAKDKAKEVASDYFQQVVHTVFTKADEDSDGTVDLTELTIALCRLHVILHKGAPGVMPFPTKSTIVAALKKNDLNADGVLNAEEFQKFAKDWFKGSGLNFAKRFLIIAAIYGIAIPTGANLLHANSPKPRIPSKILAFALTLGFKLFAAKKFAA